MTRLTHFYGLFIMVLSTFIALSAHAGNSILLWPIDPKITGDSKATELWLENRGTNTTLMQVRVFLWQQQNGQEQYQTQQEVVASPPMVRIEPGKKQLVRLVAQTPPPAGKEGAYRVLLDEIPTPLMPGQSQVGINFQMRYSVPLFVYGKGLTPDNGHPELSWRLTDSNGQQALQISNSGNMHARLSNVMLGGRTLSEGLLGYVLPGTDKTFPVNGRVPGGTEMTADLDNKTTWRSHSTGR